MTEEDSMKRLDCMPWCLSVPRFKLSRIWTAG